MSPTTLRCTVDGPVATITLARPDKMNAFNATMHAELREALDNCERDEAVRVVVLTGEGRAFSSGQDLTVDLKRDEQGRLDLGPRARPRLQPSGPQALQLSQAHHRRPERPGGRRFHEHRACLRHRRGGPLGLSAGGLRQDRPDPRCRRHLDPAAPHRPQAGAWRSCSARSRSRPRMPIAWGSSTRCSTMPPLRSMWRLSPQGSRPGRGSPIA